MKTGDGQRAVSRRTSLAKKGTLKLRRRMGEGLGWGTSRIDVHLRGRKEKRVAVLKPKKVGSRDRGAARLRSLDKIKMRERSISVASLAPSQIMERLAERAESFGYGEGRDYCVGGVAARYGKGDKGVDCLGVWTVGGSEGIVKGEDNGAFPHQRRNGNKGRCIHSNQEKEEKKLGHNSRR